MAVFGAIFFSFSFFLERVLDLGAFFPSIYCTFNFSFGGFFIKKIGVGGLCLVGPSGGFFFN
jgi:hypothetical protein